MTVGCSTLTAYTGFQGRLSSREDRKQASGRCQYRYFRPRVAVLACFLHQPDGSHMRLGHTEEISRLRRLTSTVAAKYIFFNYSSSLASSNSSNMLAAISAQLISLIAPVSKSQNRPGESCSGCPADTSSFRASAKSSRYRAPRVKVAVGRAPAKAASAKSRHWA